MPEFDDYFEPLKRLYLQSIGVDTGTEDKEITIVNGKLHGLEWRIKEQWFSRAKANVVGQLETEANELKLVAKGKDGQVVGERTLALSQAGHFKGTLSFNKRLVKTLYLIGLDARGKEVLMVQKHLS